jgi:hypothetical protein
MVDTGSNGGFTLPNSVQDAFISTDPETFFDRSVSGIYGFKTDTLVVKTLRLDDFNTSFTIKFSALGKGLIGNEFLKYFVLYMNTDDQTITLVPQSDIQIQPERQISVIPNKDNTWVVNRVSSKAQHGLKLGDILLKVNNKKPKDLYKDYCDFVMHNNELLKINELELITKRGDTIYQAMTK